MEHLINDLGLEENEAKVYQALLELGPSTVSQITKKAGITSTFGYQILEKLSGYGLANRVSSENTKLRYSAEHPRNLVQFIQNRKNHWERRLRQSQLILPDLVSLFKVAEKPIIQYQEGAEGVKNIFQQTLDSKEEILSILDIEGWDVPEFKLCGQQYNTQRSQKKIRERILILDTPQGRDWMKNYHGSFKFTNYHWIKPEQLPTVKEFGGEINVFENKVIIAILKKPNYIGVIIESSALANILKGLFELAWAQGSKYTKKQPTKPFYQYG